MNVKRGWQCKAGREQFTPYQSEDPSPTIIMIIFTETRLQHTIGKINKIQMAW